MSADSVSLGFAAAVVAANLVLGYYVYRLGGRSPVTSNDGGDAGERPIVDPETDVVECPDCGTDNDLGYRFCRNCVNELPTAASFVDRTGGPLGRAMR